MMGSEQTLKHFSHPHLLEISPYQETKNAPAKCSACKFDAAGWICTCKECNYLIHFQCSQSPRQIQLPFHKEHILSLAASESARRSGNFTCRACNKAGDGFSYSCTDCNVHIHILCATSPQMVAHESHQHPLDLEFSLPDGSGTHSFHCGICYDSGSKFNHWLYCCKECGFHAHLNCAKPKPTFAFSSSATGTNNVSYGKGSPNSAPFKGPSYGHYDDNSHGGEFDIGSNSATGTSKANDKNGRSSSTSPFKGHDDNDISSKPGGFDAHSGGTTQEQTFGGSNSATGTGKPSNENGSVNSAPPKGSPHDTKDGSGNDGGNKPMTNEQGHGGDGDDAHPGSKTPQYNYNSSDSDSDDNDDVIDCRKSKK